MHNALIYAVSVVLLVTGILFAAVGGMLIEDGTRRSHKAASLGFTISGALCLAALLLPTL